MTSPAVLSSKPTAVFPSVDLPEPLSPTRPTTVPWSTSKETPSTACSTRPAPRSKYFRRPLIRSTQFSLFMRGLIYIRPPRRPRMLQPASRAVFAADVLQLGHVAFTSLHRLRAARVIGASLGRPRQIRRTALDGRQPPAAAPVAARECSS